MSVGYKTYGFCDGCGEPMPSQILHHDHTQLRGLQKNMVRIAGKEGWIMVGFNDYCPKCAEKRAKVSEKPL